MSRTIVRTNTGGVGPLPLITTPLTNDMPITSVSLDTKGLIDTKILLYFTTQINLTAVVNTNLMFIIKKYEAKSDAQVIGGSYVFTTVAEIAESETFAFQFLDSDVNPGKYTYAIELASNSFVSIAAGVTLTNATLTLIAVGHDEPKKPGSGSSSSGSSSSGSSSSSSSSSSSNGDSSSASQSSNGESSENASSADASVQAASADKNADESSKEKKDDKKEDNKSDRKDEKKEEKKDNKDKGKK